MTLTRLTPGADLNEMPGGTWNQFCETLDRAAARFGRSSESVQLKDSAVIVKIKNDSGAARKPGHVLAISGTPLPVDSSGTPKLVYGRPLLKGVVPDDPTYFRSFVVLTGYASSGKLTDAAIAGPAWVRADRTDATHKFAKLKDATADNMKSGSSGSPVEYWELQDEAGDARLGVQWALVLLGGGGGGGDVSFKRAATTTNITAATSLALADAGSGSASYVTDDDGTLGDEFDVLSVYPNIIASGSWGWVFDDGTSKWAVNFGCG